MGDLLWSGSGTGEVVGLGRQPPEGTLPGDGRLRGVDGDVEERAAVAAATEPVDEVTYFVFVVIDAVFGDLEGEAVVDVGGHAFSVRPISHHVQR